MASKCALQRPLWKKGCKETSECVVLHVACIGPRLDCGLAAAAWTRSSLYTRPTFPFTAETRVGVQRRGGKQQQSRGFLSRLHTIYISSRRCKLGQYELSLCQVPPVSPVLSPPPHATAAETKSIILRNKIHHGDPTIVLKQTQYICIYSFVGIVIRVICYG